MKEIGASGRDAWPKARGLAFVVLLVGVLVGACGSKAPNAAPATASTGSPVSSASASSASTGSAPASGASALAVPSTSASATTASATTASPSAVASPLVLAANQVGTRSQVPWGQIGPGWFLVISDSPAVWKGAASAPPPAGTLTMWLISPVAARYAITSWSGTGSDPRNLAELDAWSGDGRHVLFGQRGDGALELDLTTGALRHIDVPQLNTIGFTGPAGSNLVANVDTSAADGTWTGQRLVRLDLSGKPQVQLAEVSQPDLPPYGGTIGWLYAADGSTVYLDGPGGLRVVSNAGGPMRALATFQPSDTDCSPVRWWDQHTILADCNNDSGSRLWLVQAAAGTATPLTGVPGANSPDNPVGLGYNNAVQVGGSVFAQHLEGCGVVTIHRLAPSGVGTRIKIPQSLSNDRLIGTVGPKLAVESTTECGSPSWFGFYDPATNNLQKIIPDGPGDLGAGSALAFP